MLGASNLTRGISTVVSWLQHNIPAPFDLYLAFGYGRSFGIDSIVWGRRLPGIKQSALWDALERRTPAEKAAPHLALITDIGNDIFYKVPVPEIVAFVRDALGRLKAMNARIILVQIPLENVPKVTRFQFFLLNHVLFPGRKHTMEGIASDILWLGKELEAIALEFGATLVAQDARWYGFDPIHYRREVWSSAWASVFGAWLGDKAGQIVNAPGFTRWAYLRTRMPRLRHHFGLRFERAQPAGGLADGSTIHVY